MIADKKTKRRANQIVAKYSKWIEPKELQNMYKELEEIGVSVGMLCNDETSCEWYINGEEVENSLYIYKVYKDRFVSETRNEYLIYFS